MNNKLIIRQATIQDLPKIVPIFDSYREYFKQQRNPVEAERYLFERFEHLESVIFIAEQNSEVIGFAQLYPTFSSLTLQRVWLLNDFFISEDYRDSGVGKQLFVKVKEFTLLTNSKGIELSVEHINKKAWGFWERQGFKMDDEFRYYFYKL
ncbi:GNAT family N-acetyltransferase [Peribacillus cavernae]|uniref:GNAT family N-acetyltransferase n=1 Tax=Peribacillus cavernae TaxID=1674310 RepID=A0A3S0TZM0_9BACI|nr:GNAT family N-acetyltransferase [Peribacillus cavernae]MDQ0219278.1 GNAT superfamily N-acetyltransferase [Peribacillus cavernae]RUQ27834.1 GNAT family N-acetyltransferase [Peribacillus cavernae]